MAALTPFEIDEKLKPILSGLISAVKVEGNRLYSLRVTPAENSIVFFVASINAATKIHTGKEKILPLEMEADTLKWVTNFCENFVNPVGFTMEGETYHWLFFPNMEPMDLSDYDGN